MADAQNSPPFDEAIVRSSYQEVEGTYEELCREVRFTLEKRLQATGLKIHSIEDRVKAVDSLILKARRLEYASPLEDVSDIAGVRVICLFRNDLQSIGHVISKNFQVKGIDDKTEADHVLGYQSIHYICELPENLAGARYEHLTKKVFEIQIRTICMHCWARISHYIDYKGDWDVPQDLKKALNALSGLFYVADSEFQQFNAARIDSKNRAAENAATRADGPQEINFDTLSAYLSGKYPDRKDGGTETVSELVHEIKSSNFKSIEEVNRVVDLMVDKLAEVEKKAIPKDEKYFYTQAGAVRRSLRLYSKEFANFVAEKMRIRAEKKAESEKETSGKVS